MLRLVVYLLFIVILISLLRYVIGFVSRAFLTFFLKPGSEGAVPRPGGGMTLEGGELKKDPVCGTYVSTKAALTKTVGGEVIYFCSEKCRQEYAKR